MELWREMLLPCDAVAAAQTISREFLQSSWKKRTLRPIIFDVLYPVRADVIPSLLRIEKGNDGSIMTTPRLPSTMVLRVAILRGQGVTYQVDNAGSSSSTGICICIAFFVWGYNCTIKISDGLRYYEFLHQICALCNLNYKARIPGTRLHLWFRVYAYSYRSVLGP
jgi:hypothetical protein